MGLGCAERGEAETANAGGGPGPRFRGPVREERPVEKEPVGSGKEPGRAEEPRPVRTGRVLGGGSGQVGGTAKVDLPGAASPLPGYV